jgi:predicted nucleotide-binding protein (sugar kinase/HSP70/actin superfamily)
MAHTLAETYRAYKPLPFTTAERETTTVLYGGLHWRAERLIQGVFENLGYHARALPVATKEDLLTGREMADIGQCCPTSFTTGNLANFLRKESALIGKEAVARKYVHVTAGSCGSCRFGQYHQSYELALRNIGLEAFRMFLFEQSEFDQGPMAGGGLDINLPFTLGLLWALIASDLVQDLEYRTRPYEVNPGETERVSRAAVEFLYGKFRQRPLRGGKYRALAWHLMTGYFADAMRKVRRRFALVEVDRLRVKPVVKITGEFYLQTVEGEPNYNIHRWLEAEGAEVYPAAISVWMDYLWRLAGQEAEAHIGIESNARAKKLESVICQQILRHTYGRLRRALGNVPHEMPDQIELRSLAAPYFNNNLTGGEGDMLIGKALWAYHNKKAHMTCELSPYSCMPNTMSIGAMAAVTGRYPDLLYAPLEIKGDSEVHALSRCQMILTEAKRRAQREFEETLARTQLSLEDVRRLQQRFPETGCATFQVSHQGVAGTAANLVLYLHGKNRS